MTKQCDVCHTKLIEGVNATRFSRRCIIVNSRKRSECEKKKRNQTIAASKAYREEVDRSCKLPELDKSNSRMRSCLKCDELPDGTYPLFESLSPGNRVCPKHDNKMEGYKITKLLHIEASGDFMRPVEATNPRHGDSKINRKYLEY